MGLKRLRGLGYIVALAGVAVAGLLLGRMFVGSREQPPARTGGSLGSTLYGMHCAVCHGQAGRGDGPGARALLQPMRDFTDAAAMRTVDDRFLFEIIKKGGSQFGRSNAMPAWGMKMSDDEIRALVAHIRSLTSGAASAGGERKGTP